MNPILDPCITNTLKILLKIEKESYLIKAGRPGPLSKANSQNAEYATYTIINPDPACLEKLSSTQR